MPHSPPFPIPKAKTEPFLSTATKEAASGEAGGEAAATEETTGGPGGSPQATEEAASGEAGGEAAATEEATGGPGSGAQAAEEKVTAEFPSQLPVTGTSLDWKLAPIALGVILLLLGAGASALDLTPRKRMRR